FRPSQSPPPTPAAASRGPASRAPRCRGLSLRTHRSGRTDSLPLACSCCSPSRLHGTQRKSVALRNIVEARAPRVVAHSAWEQGVRNAELPERTLHAQPVHRVAREGAPAVRKRLVLRIARHQHGQSREGERVLHEAPKARQVHVPVPRAAVAPVPCGIGEPLRPARKHQVALARAHRAHLDATDEAQGHVAALVARHHSTSTHSRVSWLCGSATSPAARTPPSTATHSAPGPRHASSGSSLGSPHATSTVSTSNEYLHLDRIWPHFDAHAELAGALLVVRVPDDVLVLVVHVDELREGIAHALER